MTTIADRLKKIVADYHGLDAATLTAETRFDEDIKSDSLERVEVLMQVEDAFGIEISDEDGVKVATIGDAIAIVERTIKVESPS